MNPSGGLINYNALKLVKVVSENTKSIEQLEEHEIQHIGKHIAYNEILANSTQIYEQSKIDYDAEVNNFINEYCTNSKLVIKRALEVARTSVAMPCYSWSVRDIDQWYRVLSTSFSISTARSYQSCIKTFCSFVVARNPKITMPSFPPMKKRMFKLGIKENKDNIDMMSRRERDHEIPSKEEVETIIDNVRSPRMKCMISLMYWNGLRSDGVRNIEIKGNTFTTYSKGKKLAGTIHPNVMPFLIYQGTPFIAMPQQSLSTGVLSATKRIAKIGLIKHWYSPHKFRHACAVRVWNETNDLSKVARVLGHRFLTTTDKYLKSITGGMEREGYVVLDNH